MQPQMWNLGLCFFCTYLAGWTTSVHHSNEVITKNLKSLTHNKQASEYIYMKLIQPPLAALIIVELDMFLAAAQIELEDINVIKYF